MNTKQVCRFVLLGAVLLCAVGPAASDVESPELAKYKKPLEASVDRALAYLATAQIPPGQPLAGAFESPGLPGSPGVTSLCVMAFLSKGHTPGTGTYGEVINRGIDYVLTTYNASDSLLMRPNRKPPEETMYSHCIGTLMLAEVSGMVDPERQRKIDAVLPKALNVIVSAQRVRKGSRDAGGWRYYPNSRDSDLSLTGWAVMALRAGRLNGAAVPKECIDKAVLFIMNCRIPSGGFRYTNIRGNCVGLTGVGVLCLELCGRHGDPATTAGGDYLLRLMPGAIQKGDSTGYYSYGMYYCSQAMFQLGGRYWETWAPVMYETLMKSQHADGAWPADVVSAGQACSTAMAVLAMTVSYRQLPIYQR